jgi:hypothetical protein
MSEDEERMLEVVYESDIPLVLIRLEPEEVESKMLEITRAYYSPLEFGHLALL